MGNEIALFCTMHPASQEKQQRCLDLLRKSAREYYRQPHALCTTWSYFTTFPPPKSSSSSSHPTFGGLEIYTDKKAFSDQLNEPTYFQSYRDTVMREELYAKPEELVAWYLTAGFIARETHAQPFGNVIITTTNMVCKDNRGNVLDVLRSFVDWVRTNEPNVLTYAIFTRPKAPNEVLIFVRYRDTKALKAHDQAPEHQAVLNELGRCLRGSRTTLWKEVQDSFVSNVTGGGHEQGSKL